MKSVMSSLAEIDPSLIRQALAGIVAYEPGKPIEEVQRELGLDRVVKLASNEGPFGPFPAALAAMERSFGEQNRYPDGECFRLREALAEQHGVRREEVTVCAGGDAVIGYVCQALLGPGDEMVTGWPAFISYVVDTLKQGATPVKAPLRANRLDLDAMLDAITPRTKVVFIATPNNPTGTMTSRTELDRYFASVPEHVLTVVDQAYFEYVAHPDYPDAVAEYARAGHRVLVVRTFSKMYGLAGMRVGYGIGPAALIQAIGKVRRPFDVTSLAQEAALASYADRDEVGRRRRVNRDAMAALEAALNANGLRPVGPAVANFVLVEVGDRAGALADALLRRGVIVRPAGAFGAADALRITAGTPEEIAYFAEQLPVALDAL